MMFQTGLWTGCYICVKMSLKLVLKKCFILLFPLLAKNIWDLYFCAFRYFLCFYIKTMNEQRNMNFF